MYEQLKTAIKDIDYSLDGLERILKHGWDIKKGNHALIITDLGINNQKLAPLLAHEEIKALKLLGCSVDIHIQNPKGAMDSLDETLFEKIEKLKKGSIVVISVSDSVGHLPDSLKNISFKSYILNKGLKMVFSRSLAEVEEKNYQTFINAITLNTEPYMKQWLKIKDIIDKGKSITIKTDEGTNLTLDIQDRKALLTCGEYKYGGTNLPFGEVYIAPVENGSNGTVIVNGTSKSIYGSELLKDSFHLEFKDGKIINTTSKNIQETIDTIIKKDKTNNTITTLAELGIGINPKAKSIGLMLLDEKVLGTSHVAIGSNTSFGGINKCAYHFDQVFKKPKFFVDGKELKI